MAKLTWQQLGRIYEGAYGVTVEEAAKIISNEIFGRNWKHGSKKGTFGRMWGDEIVVAAFTHVLEEEDKLVKKFGRNKAVRKLFKSDIFERFLITAKLTTYTNYKTFKNDYGKWKKLKAFKNVWKKGKITSKKIEKRIKARVRAADKILKAENKNVLTGREHTKRLIASGKYEQTPSGLRKIIK